MKRIIIAVLTLCILATAGFTGLGIWKTVSERPVFYAAGSVLQGEAGEVKSLGFEAEEPYTVTQAGYVSFRDTEGEKITVRRESFAHMDDNSVMAMSDGVLLDFADLSENFINNYFITAGLAITPSGETYNAQTASGAITFGENLWKLSEEKYLVQSPSLRVFFSEEDIREAGEYVQVVVTKDGIVQLLTEENLWSTISPECYIETAGGVKVYPITQIVESGTYKLSLAKLSVSADDGIVLTEDETRRQIVPELNFEAIDGEDGEDGEAGEIGETGEDGEAGAAGAAGEAGAVGASGQEGAKGEAGMDAENGIDGVDGAEGGNGTDGAAGTNGSGGRPGYTGAKGNDAQVQSTVNTSLPSMTFTDWQITATGLKGAIHVKDESGLLGALTDKVGTDTASYMGTVTIYNDATGEQIHCYNTVDDRYNLDGVTEDDFGFSPGLFEDEATVYFSTMKEPLVPDTSYRISVVAYYLANEMVYSREFVSRIFYTDSTGVLLAKDSAKETSVTVTATVGEAYRGAVKTVEVILLTPEQNISYNPTSSSGYTSKYVLDYVNKTITYWPEPGTSQTLAAPSPDYQEDLLFENLLSDQNYIGRVYVSSDSGSGTLNALTKQELELTTLKRAPLWDEDEKPTAFYNRVTGAFEVYRPDVIDVDSGAVRYVYTAYEYVDGKWVQCGTKEAVPNATGPTSFYLPSEKDYRFQVEMEFNDNEKTVFYDLGQSESIRATGDTMPKMVLEVEETNTGKDYDTIRGYLKINLSGQSTALHVSKQPDMPLELHIYADQIYDRTITIPVPEQTVMQTVNGETIYTALLRANQSSANEAVVDLNLLHLYKNTNYTITATGYLDLGDGNGPVKRAIGTVSFRTATTVPLVAKWSTNASDTSAISRLLQIEPQLPDSGNPAFDADREAYAAQQLKAGQVTLKLSRGTGPSRQLLSTVTISDQNDVNLLYGNVGMPVTEHLFGLSLEPSTAYTLEIGQVADHTFAMTDLGYLNTFEVVSGQTEVVTAEATPPDLLAEPTNAVRVVPILNSEAAMYNGAYNENLPDDAIVGYRLNSNYDNSQRLGVTVTYYAFEYTTYYNALVTSRTDPVELALKDKAGTSITLVPSQSLTFDIDPSSDTVPGVALLFGGKDGGTDGGDAGIAQGYHVYYAGAASQQSSKLVGMDRGYRYVFAYTVEYSVNGDSGGTVTYPYYPTKAYNEYKNAYGAGTEYGKSLGKGVAYILNSGMLDAPKVSPEFHTYVYDTQNTSWGNMGASSGTITLHYTWRDFDSTISTNEPRTQIWFTDVSGGSRLSQAINQTPISDVNAELNWYEITLPYRASVSEEESLVEPTVDVNIYSIDYTAIMQALTQGTEYAGEDESFYLCHIPVDRAFGERFQNNTNQVMVTQDMSHLEDNYIDYILVDNNTESPLSTDLGQRAYAMRLDFSVKNEPDLNKTVYLPVNYVLGTGYYARLATGELGSQYIGKKYTVEAQILYDTGDQGWSLVEGDDPCFALQYINEQADWTKFRLGNYFVSANVGTGATPGGALVKKSSASFNAGTLRTLLKSDLTEDTTIRFDFYGISGNWSNGRYLYPDHWGVAASGNQNLTSMQKLYIVPKGVATYTLKFANDQNTGTLTKITPTIDEPKVHSAATQLDIGDFTVHSFDQAEKENGKYVVHAALYDTKENAEKLTSEGFVTGSHITLVLDEATGKPIVEDEFGNPLDIITGLDPNNKYFLVFYMKSSEGNVILIDNTTAQKAIYQHTTSSDVIFDSSMGLLYRNDGYFDKQFTLNFTMSRVAGVTLRYDLLDEAGNVVLSYEEMQARNMIQSPSVLYSGGNDVKIDLTPGVNRKEIVPGGTYTLKLSATENGTPVGEKSYTQTVPAVNNYGALIYVKEATSDSITYQVSMNDVGYSYMGSRNYQNGVGLYAVRFTDINGTWIPTVYDGKVYTTDAAQREFVLDQSALYFGGLNIGDAPDKKYVLNVYAVVDVDHDGNSEPTTLADSTGKDWKYFFGETESTPEAIGQKFGDFLKNFWESNMSNDGYHNLTNVDELERSFCVWNRTQELTDDSGLLINMAQAALSRKSGLKVQLVLAESFGVVKDGVQAFQQVDWQIDGYANDKTPILYSGTETGPEVNFVKTTDGAGYDMFTYELPRDVPYGNYTVTIQLRKTADSPAPDYTFTFKLIG